MSPGESATSAPSAEIVPHSPPRAVLRSLRGRTSSRAAQGVVRALWVGVIPALVAVVFARHLAPDALAWAAVGASGRRTVIFGLLLFLLFSLLARYWRFHVPGGRYASRLPAHLVPEERDACRLEEWAGWAALHEILVSPSTWQRLARTTDGADRRALEDRIAALGRALEEGCRPEAEAAARSAAVLARDALAARRRGDAFAVVALAVFAAAAAFVLRAGAVEPYRVLSGSMLPTLEPGDRVAGNRLAYAPAGSDGGRARTPLRGDVVVFRSGRVALGREGVPAVMVKRVIGLPGDRIVMRGGVPVINDWVVPFCDAGPYLFVTSEPEVLSIRGRLRVEFLGERAYLTVQSMTRAFDVPFVVPPGEVFVLGDNRSNSLDSRAWNEGRGGGVPGDAIEARADWFVTGTHRSGDVDLGRLLQPLDTRSRALHVEGLDVQGAEEGVTRCLSSRPAVTLPPPPPIASSTAHGEGS
jgi:signal peptidase I